MVITLKSGEDLELDWNPLILEYLEDYDGGFEALKRDADSKDRRMLVGNFIIYAIICANYDEELTYRQAVSLVKVDDIEKIMDFVIENTKQEKQKVKNTKTNKHRR